MACKPIQKDEIKKIFKDILAAHKSNPKNRVSNMMESLQKKGIFRRSKDELEFLNSLIDLVAAKLQGDNKLIENENNILLNDLITLSENIKSYNNTDKEPIVTNIKIVDTDETGLIQIDKISSISSEGQIEGQQFLYQPVDEQKEESIALAEELESDTPTLVKYLTKTRFAGSSELHSKVHETISSELFSTVFINFNKGIYINPLLGTDRIDNEVRSYLTDKTNQAISIYNALTDVSSSPFNGNPKIAIANNDLKGALNEIQNAINKANLTPSLINANPSLANLYTSFIIADDFDILIKAYDSTNSLITKDKSGTYKLVNQTTIREGANIIGDVPSAIDTASRLLKNMIQNIKLSNGNFIHFNTFSRLVADNIPPLKSSNYQEEIATYLKEAIGKVKRKTEKEILQKVYDRFYNPELSNSLVNIIIKFPDAQSALTVVNQYISSITNTDIVATVKRGKDGFSAKSIIPKSSGTAQKIQNSFVNNVHRFASQIILDPNTFIKVTNEGIYLTYNNKTLKMPSKVKIKDIDNDVATVAKQVFSLLYNFDLNSTDYNELFDTTTSKGRINVAALINSNRKGLALAKSFSNVLGKNIKQDKALFDETLALLKTHWKDTVTINDVTNIAKFNKKNNKQQVIDKFAISTVDSNIKNLINNISNIVDDLSINNEKAIILGVEGNGKPKIGLHTYADDFEAKIAKLSSATEEDVDYYNILNEKYSKTSVEGNVKVVRIEGFNIPEEKAENKKADKITDAYNQIVSNYYGRLIPTKNRDKGDAPIYTPIVFSDKQTPRGFLVDQSVVTDTSLTLEGQIRKTLEMHFNQNRDYYNKKKEIILKDFETVLGISFKSLESLNSYLISKQQTEGLSFKDFKNKLSEQFHAAGLELVDNIHINEMPVNNLLALNPLLLAKVKYFNTATLEQFIKSMRKRALDEATLLQKELNNAPFKIPYFIMRYYIDNANTAEYRNYLESFVDVEFVDNDLYTETIYTTKLVNGDQVNPIYEKFFYEFSMLQDSLTRLMHGDITQYKGSRAAEDIQSDQNARFTEQGKRAGNLLSTGPRLQLELDNGIENTQTLAIVKDIEGSWKGFLGQQNVKYDKYDGAMLMTTIHSRQHANSLGNDLGQDAGVHFKTVGFGRNTRLGFSTLRKWLAFSLTNETIRNNPTLENQYRKMLSATIEGKKLVVHKPYRTYVYNPDTKEVSTVLVSKGDEFDTIYDLWKFLGGAYTLKPDPEGFIDHNGQSYSYADYKTVPVTDSAGNLLHSGDIVNEVLAQDKRDTLSENKRLNTNKKYFKQVMVDGVAMASSVKTGKANVNTVEDFNNPDAKYTTQRVDNSDYLLAITLKKSYEKEEGRKTVKSTQLIGALSLGGNTPELTNHAYNVLKLITEYSINRELQKIFSENNWSTKYLDTILRVTQEKLKTDLENRDSISLANDIIDTALPADVNYDSGQLKGILATALTSYLTKEGIKQKVAGAQMVIMPPVIPVYEVVERDKNGNIISKQRMVYEAAKRFVANNPTFELVEAPQDLKSADTLISYSVIEEFFDLTEEQKEYYNQLISEDSSMISVYDLHTVSEMQKLEDPIEIRKLQKLNDKFVRFLESQKTKLSDYNAFRNDELIYTIIPGEVLMSPINAKKFGLKRGMQPQDVTVDFFIPRAKKIHSKLENIISKLKDDAETITDTEINIMLVYQSLQDRIAELNEMTDEEWRDKHRSKSKFKDRTQELQSASRNLTTIETYQKVAPKTEKEILEKINLEKLNGDDDKSNSLYQLKLKINYLLDSYENRVKGQLSKLKNKIKKFQGNYDGFVRATAEEIYKSFLLSNRVTNMRIPLQSFASVMHNNAIGYLWDMNLTIMVNDKHQSLTGGDFDADKSNSELLSFDNNGRLIPWKKDLDVTDEGTWITSEHEIKDALENGDISVKGAINYVTYLTSVMASSPANLTARESEISLDDIKQKASESKKAKAASALRPNSFTSVIDLRNANMTALDAIGIFASSIKALSTIHNANHIALRELNNFYGELEIVEQLGREDQINRLKEEINSIIEKMSFELEFNGNSYRLIDTLNFDNFNEETIDNLIASLYDESSSPEATNVFNQEREKLIGQGMPEQEAEEQASLKLIDYIKEQISLRYENYNTLGQFLNAAVDNAKELVLDKINSDSQLSSVYSLSSMVGIPLNEVIDLLTSSTIEAILKKSSKSPLGGRYNSIDSLINLVIENTTNRITLENAQQFKKLYDAANELKVLSKALGVNGGLPTSAFGLYKYKIALEDHINGRIQSTGQDDIFDLERFINALYYENDTDYVNTMIDAYNKVKSVNNIPWIFSLNPHFVQQIKLLIDTVNWEKSLSYKAKNTTSMINAFVENGFVNPKSVNEKIYNAVEKMQDEMVIFSYYRDKSFRYNVDFTVLRENGTTQRLNNIDLSTVQGREDFINWMHTLIPVLQANIRNNSFLQELVFSLTKQDNFGTQDMKYQMVFNPIEVKTDGQKLKLETLKQDFKKLGTITLGDNKYDIKELFVHYNRIMNKEQLRADSLTSIIDVHPLVQDFWAYQASLRDTFNADNYLKTEDTYNLDILKYLAAEYGIAPKGGKYKLILKNVKGINRVYDADSKNYLEKSGRIYDFDNPSNNLIYITLKGKVKEQEKQAEASTLVGEDLKPAISQQESQQTNYFPERNIFTVEPIQSKDKKAKSKAKISTQYIGFAEGIAGSSTALYAKQISGQSNNPSITANIPQNLVSGVEAFGTKQEANSTAKKLLGSNPHSIDMIEAGIRTRTTRSVKEMQKYNIKVGDIVKQFGKSADGTTKTILTKITAIHPKGTPEFLDTWEKEGWTSEGVERIKRFKNGAAAIEFEVIKSDIVNSGNYSSNDVIFVSIPGKRGNAQVRKAQQDKTIEEAIKAIEAGATLITDNAAYVKSSSYNEGEKRLAARLKSLGYNYSETTVDGNVLGVWTKSAIQSSQISSQEPVLKIEDKKPITQPTITTDTNVKYNDDESIFDKLEKLKKENLEVNSFTTLERLVEVGFLAAFEDNGDITRNPENAFANYLYTTEEGMVRPLRLFLRIDNKAYSITSIKSWEDKSLPAKFILTENFANYDTQEKQLKEFPELKPIFKFLESLIQHDFVDSQREGKSVEQFEILRNTSIERLKKSMISTNNKFNHFANVKSKDNLRLALDREVNKRNDTKSKHVQLTSILQKSSTQQDVSELFESNPELADEIYGALGFKNNTVTLDDYQIHIDGKRTFKNGDYTYSIIKSGMYDDRTLFVKKEGINKNMPYFALDLDIKDDLIRKTGLNSLKSIFSYSDENLRDELLNNIGIALNSVGISELEFNINAEVENTKRNKVLFDRLNNKITEEQYLDFLHEGDFTPSTLEYFEKTKKLFSEIKNITDKTDKLEIELQEDKVIVKFININWLTPQQKQEAQKKFQEYVNATGKQDIEGFKEYIDNQASTAQSSFEEVNVETIFTQLLETGTSKEKIIDILLTRGVSEAEIGELFRRYCK